MRITSLLLLGATLTCIIALSGTRGEYSEIRDEYSSSRENPPKKRNLLLPEAGLQFDEEGEIDCSSCGPKCKPRCGSRSFRLCCFRSFRKRAGGGEGRNSSPRLLGGNETGLGLTPINVLFPPWSKPSSIERIYVI